MDEIAVVVVAGTVVALVMGVKEKNDGRETRQEDDGVRCVLYRTMSRMDDVRFARRRSAKTTEGQYNLIDE
mgnify:CR=1 FL=1